MFGNCDEKTSEIDDHHKVSMASNGSTRVMEKPGQDLVQQQQQALRCPRCDSSNTKFCYYNNYSLSQPRHFCKACKRYWTRGGTLRNVPVGGGCRKNKRVKRSSTTHSSNNIDNSTNTIVASPSSSSNPTSANSNPPSQLHNFDISNSTSNHINTLLYGGGNGNSCHDVMNFPFSTRFNSRVVSSSSSGYDNLQVNNSCLGLGFSSGLLMSGSGGEVNHHYHDAGYNRNGFSSNNNNNHTLVSSYNSIFGSSSTSTNSLASTPVMTSLLSSTLLQQKFMSSTGTSSGGMKDDIFHHEMKMEGNSSSEVAGIMASKEVKLCEGQNRLQEWNNVNANGGVAVAFQNQMEHLGLSDTSSLYWNNHNSSNTATGLGVWSDQPNNIGPSVTSLI
ncbi:uncharacterized protein [Cicer arietinum]|uniref:Dof zinc finger protein n=1 Tax=Cicer arietinum TaxID=3827 RepID=A0A3Q7YGB0_CICAR|nr:dof zinc finger protein DOF1.4-like isoform X2 [Cicer arietinum]